MLGELYEIMKSEGCDTNNDININRYLCDGFSAITVNLMIDSYCDEDIDIDLIKNADKYYEDLLWEFLDGLNNCGLSLQWSDLNEFNDKYKDIICNYLIANSEQILINIKDEQDYFLKKRN